MKNSRRAISLSRSMLLRSARANKFGSTKARTVLLQSTKRSAPLLRSSHSSSSSSSSFSSSSSSLPILLGVATGLSLTSFYTLHADTAKTNWDDIKKEILALLDDPKYDDGSYGPVLVRLAWHASGTYSKADGSGGSSGGTMRFKHEASDGANAGLDVARSLLEPIKQRHPEISYGDLWTFAGSVAIEKLGGPKIDWRPGRRDKDEKAQPPHGRLPDASKGQDHVRDVFYRMGFNDREIVALIGAHALGRCHPNRSGYDGPWTSAPTSFTNEFYVLLLEAKWKPRKWDGPLQYEDSSKTLMMTPADLAFVQDPEFKKYVELYANDEDLWFTDFAAAWKKLIELGVSFDAPAAPAAPAAEKKSLWKRIFG